ncbi:hypothetical protein WKI65_43860 [Streptomyces sp. MS1.AVA.3]|uniref:hypothetical protein n=1 Tax=Streptomyces decoyicus TaxID=249567 RepID=UPI0030C54DF3
MAKLGIPRLRRPRLRTLAIPVLGALATLAVLAPAAAADGHTGYEPAGIGDMMPSPTKPSGQGTLFETYRPNVYQLDMNLSDDIFSGDLVDSWMYGLCQALMGFLAVIGRAAVTVTQWCFQVVSLPEVEHGISKAISAAAGPMTTMFLPTAVAVGVFIAWAKHADRSVLGQLAWVAASAAIATTFLTAPSTWIKGVDNVRQIGSSVAMTTLASALDSGDAAVPFKTPEPSWTGKAKDDTIRRASDAVWRTYVVVPWCVADLGSLKACKKWGPELLKEGSDMEVRQEFLEDNLTEDTVGTEAVEWHEGRSPGGRLGILLAALVSVVIFSALVITLAFTTLASLLGALMLLVCGVVFATLWCIPGKPRQWGTQWFEMLLGLTLVSFTSSMLLGSVLVVTTAMLTMLHTYGWLMVSALNIAAAITAFRVKGRLDGIVSGGGAQLAGRGFLGMMTGVLSANRRVNRLGGGGGSGGQSGGGLIGRYRRARDRIGGSGNGGSAGGPVRPQAGPRPGAPNGRGRNIPPPPNYPPTVHIPHGGTPASPPGGGPTGPAGSGPGRPGSGSRGPGSTGSGTTRPAGTGPGRTGGTAPGPRGTTRRPSAGTAGPYTVRPGSPPPSGVPPRTATPSHTISGTATSSSSNPAGGRFRSYPPPTSRPSASGGAAPRSGGPSRTPPSSRRSS